jgi:hypothetical protein
MDSIDMHCPYYSGKLVLKCAVNPSIPCKDCSEVSEGFNTDTLDWMETLRNADMLQGQQIFEVMRQSFVTAQERISEIRIPRSEIVIDEGSGQDATKKSGLDLPLKWGVYID